MASFAFAEKFHIHDPVLNTTTLIYAGNNEKGGLPCFCNLELSRDFGSFNTANKIDGFGLLISKSLI